MPKKYLTPNISDLYIAPRGIKSSEHVYNHKAFVPLGMHILNKVIRRIDYLDTMGRVTGDEAMSIFNTVRKVVAETITQN